MVQIPNASTMNWFKLSGKTSELNKGLSTDFRTFTVSKQGEFNFAMSDTQTTVKIMNSKNEVVADASSGAEGGSASAKLAPGTYTALIQQKYKGVNNRDYNLEITPRQNALVTAAGGALKGVAREAVGQDSGVQRHSLNVVQGGDFAVNMSMPYSRWSIMSKDGKVVASGDTMKPEENKLDVLNKTFKLEPGQYELIAVLPRKVVGEVPWRVDLIPKVAGAAEAAATTEERPIDKILRERDERLKRWASEDAAGASTSA